MRSQGPGGPYYGLLNQVARFLQSDAIGVQLRVGVLVVVVASLLSLAWMLANMYVMQSGELPGTQAYDRVLFSYLMRLVCGESLVVGGLLLSTLWAQQAGRIPQYGAAVERE